MPSKYKPTVFGSRKTGYIGVKRDGTITYAIAGSSPVKFNAAEVTSASIEDGASLVRRSTLARTGGGAIAGGILLGPVGLLAGLGLGAISKKESGGEKYVVIDLADGRSVMAQVDRKHTAQAFALVQQLRSQPA